MNLVRLQYGGGGGELHGASITVNTEESTLVGKEALLYKVSDLSTIINRTVFSALSSDGVSTATFNNIIEPDIYIVKSSNGTEEGNTSNIEITSDDIINKTTLVRSLSLTLELNITFYSASGETIKYKRQNSDELILLGKADDTGKGNGTIIFKDGETITFSGDIAKDTTTATSAYSKDIIITSDTTEIYVMPDNTIYWYGNAVNCEDCHDSSDWSSPTEDNLKKWGKSVVFQTNYCDVALNFGGGLCALGAKQPIIGCKKAYIIARYSTTYYDGEYKYGYFGVANSKIVPYGGSDLVNITAKDYTKYSVDMTDNQYPFIEAKDYGGAFVQAMWCE